MEGADKAEAYFPVEEKSIEEIEQWFIKQYAPTLAMLLQHHGGDLSAIAAYARNGMGRLRPKHLALIASAKKTSRDREGLLFWPCNQNGICSKLDSHTPLSIVLLGNYF